MAYILFISSGTDVTIEPEFDFREAKRKQETRHRTQGGREYVYKWGNYTTWRFSVEYVNSSFRAIVNSWWDSNADLLFMHDTDLVVSSVRLLGTREPISGFVRPYDDLFKGTIELGTY